MSRIGKQPIEVPGGVEVDVADGNVVTVKGPRGTLTSTMHPDMKILVERRRPHAWSGPTTRASTGACTASRASLLANMVDGVTKGFEKRLQIVGVGYRAAMKGSDLEIAAGYSHPVIVPQPAGIEFEVPTPTSIVVRGNDKQQVGEIAANIRKVRKPEPYKGKGIRYEGEYVRKKAGKAAKTGAA